MYEVGPAARRWASGQASGSWTELAQASAEASEFTKRQMRYSITFFSRYPFTERLYCQDAAYLQIAASALDDHRLYYESSMNYRLQKATLSLRYRLRYFRKSYVSGNTPTDQSIVFRVQLGR